jgi:hypothetical protein
MTYLKLVDTVTTYILSLLIDMISISKRINGVKMQASCMESQIWTQIYRFHQTNLAN